jgi:hypothetical protein
MKKPVDSIAQDHRSYRLIAKIARDQPNVHIIIGYNLRRKHVRKDQFREHLAVERSSREQFGNKAPANEPGRAGHDDAHGLS